MKNGAMKIPSARVLSEAASWPPILNTIRKPSAFFRKLSLNAEKNWHQNSGAKRRDVIRWSDIVIPQKARGECSGYELACRPGQPSCHRQDGRPGIHSGKRLRFLDRVG